MRLVDLNPKWLFEEDGTTKIGFIFDCPTRPGRQQTCFFKPTLFREQCRAVWAIQPKPNDPDAEEYGSLDWQPCNPRAAWNCVPLIFDQISVTPSLDGSAAGNWHGFIKNGNIEGGLS